MKNWIQRNLSLLILLAFLIATTIIGILYFHSTSKKSQSQVTFTLKKTSADTLTYIDNESDSTNVNNHDKLGQAFKIY